MIASRERNDRSFSVLQSTPSIRTAPAKGVKPHEARGVPDRVAREGDALHHATALGGGLHVQRDRPALSNEDVVMDGDVADPYRVTSFKMMVLTIVLPISATYSGFAYHRSSRCQ